MSKPLSPVPQEVINATAKQVLADGRINLEHIAAAALRALAEQAGSAKHWHVNEILAIADELEGVK